MGWVDAEPGTLLGYKYSMAAIIAIAVSALLGLLVSLSTFLVIGATSSLTYNVVGHIKTVIILMGGCMFFGDEMPLKKLGGISVAMGGIIWYSQVCCSPLPGPWLATPPGCRTSVHVQRRAYSPGKDVGGCDTVGLSEGGNMFKHSVAAASPRGGMAASVWLV